jgi:hypothetical protein
MGMKAQTRQDAPEMTTTHLVCSNCGGSDTAAFIAAFIAAITALITLQVANATLKTAKATDKLATLDDERRTRELRGIARLIRRELALLQATINEALSSHSWEFYWASPGVAWDQGGRVIVAEMDKDEADELIDVVAELQKWARVASRERERQPGSMGFS